MKNELLQLIPGSPNPFIYYPNRKEILEVDMRSLQRRFRLLPISDQEIPLYIDPYKRRLYTWYLADKDGNRGIIAYNQTYSQTYKLKFEKNDKLLQNNNFFGVAKFNTKENKIVIVQLPRWSGEKRRKDYVLQLPKDYPVLEAQIRVHFGQKVAVLHSKKWDRVFIVRYDTKDSLIYPIPKGVKNHFLEISPSGKYMALDLVDNKTQLTRQVMVLEIKKKTWKKFNF